jgi:pantothenate kinase
MPLELTLTFPEAVAFVAHDARTLADTLGRRVLYGVAGGPGVGKSTIAAEVAGTLADDTERSAVVVPMDGFHMRHAKLEALGLAGVKGAPQTFEAADFAAHLATLKSATATVRGPGYSRKIEDVVDDLVTVPAEAAVLVVEGNYLLLGEGAWPEVRAMLDRRIFLDVARPLVRERLLRRHAEEGLFTAERNLRHVDTVDLPNYDLVAASRAAADVAITIATPV